MAQLVACYVLVNPEMLNMGYLGLALGRVLGNLVGFLVNVSIIWGMGLQRFVWEKQASAEATFLPGAFKEFFKISGPAAMVIWSEWWAFEVLALEVGVLPNAEYNLAAHGTMYHLILICYMAWVSANIAMCTLVGERLGAHRNTEIPPL